MRERQGFDAFIVDMSEAFIKGRVGDRQLIDSWLERLAKLARVDRVTLWHLSPDGGRVLRHNFYIKPGQAPPPPGRMLREQFGWLMEQSLNGKVVAWSRMPDDVPREATSEREYGERIGARSLLSIPVSSGSTLCVLAFVSLRRYHRWSARTIQRLRAISAILAVVAVRDRAESSLRESEDRFRGAFEHSAIGIAIVALDGRWLRVNRALCQMLGYSAAELMDVRFQGLTHPEDLALNLEYFRRAIDGELEHYELNKRYIHKDGHSIPALLSVSIVRDDEQHPLYFVSQLQDLSERARSQVEIERLRLDLHHFGRLALTGQLTASLAHELAQPVATARLNAEACQLLILGGASVPGGMSEALTDIISSCGRAEDVIQNVRSLLRKERSPRVRLSMNRLVVAIVEVCRHDLRMRGVRHTTNLEPGLPMIEANPIELQQVILNLALNAAEAMKSSQNRDLRIETKSIGQGIELAVHDTGSGVDGSDLMRMFEPFFTTKLDGMGMGLPICSEIVRAHGGRIWAELNPPGGVTVHCVFPLAGPENTQRGAAIVTP